MVVFYVMAVDEAIVLVFENAMRVGLGFTAGVGHRAKCERAIWGLLHVIPCLPLKADFLICSIRKMR